jgi:hypothetical protein
MLQEYILINLKKVDVLPVPLREIISSRIKSAGYLACGEDHKWIQCPKFRSQPGWPPKVCWASRGGAVDSGDPRKRDGAAVDGVGLYDTGASRVTRSNRRWAKSWCKWLFFARVHARGHVGQSNRPCDLKRKSIVYMWYVIMFQDHRYLEPPIPVVRRHFRVEYCRPKSEFNKV